MTKNKLKLLLISAFVVTVVCCNQMQQTVNNNSGNTRETAVSNANTSGTPPAPCNASADWVNSPNPPTEIPNSGATLCDFYQFSYQWLISMMTMNGTNRTFQNEQNYPLYLGGTQDSCGTTNVTSRIFVRTLKDRDNPKDDFVLPQDINQAGSDSVIYDQNGNVVYYEVRFSRSQCTQNPSQPQFTDTGTTEMKISYRVITETDKPNYIWINADINGDGKIDPTELLGMVGFHLVKSTALHPEFVWATFEHKQNVPECQQTADTSKTWSFASSQCAAQLPNSVNAQQCPFNNPAAPSPTPVLSGGPPTQICRVYHDATMTGDNQYQTNLANIDMLNTQLVGPSGFITALPASNPLAVLKNYMLVGALWESNVQQPSCDSANQRGSIQLANSTMETTFQGASPYTGPSSASTAANCFTCHNYTPGNNVALSHIFSGIKGSSQKTN